MEMVNESILEGVIKMYQNTILSLLDFNISLRDISMLLSTERERDE